MDRCRAVAFSVIATAFAWCGVPGSTRASLDAHQASDARSLDAVLQRAAEWVASFQREFSSFVVEEQFEQRLTVTPGIGLAVGRPDTLRATRSDLLLLRLVGRDGWLPFRDVFEVNGRPVRDREERLRRLFLEKPATALADAARLNDESSRYNLGSVVRTINVPTFALMLLGPRYARRLAFEKLGEGQGGGVATLRIGFVERVSPTIVKTISGTDVRLEGSYWIDPTSGGIAQTLIKTRGTPDPDKPIPPPGTGETLMWVQVTYESNAQYGIRVPASMTEWARAPNASTVSGKATYSAFRRFEVVTGESIAPNRR